MLSKCWQFLNSYYYSRPFPWISHLYNQLLLNISNWMSDSQFRLKTSDSGPPWWLRHHTSNVGGPNLIPGQGTGQFCQENALVIANTLFQQDKRRLYTWTSPDGQHWNQIDYILCSWRWRSSIQSAKIRQGADCGSDHELLIAKFRLKLKKVGKTTKPFRYDLNQIPYDYTVEMRNRFKGLDLIECLMNYGWRFMRSYRRQGARSSPRKRNAKKQNGYLRRPYK